MGFLSFGLYCKYGEWFDIFQMLLHLMSTGLLEDFPRFALTCTGDGLTDDVSKLSYDHLVSLAGWRDFYHKTYK